MSLLLRCYLAFSFLEVAYNLNFLCCWIREAIDCSLDGEMVGQWNEPAILSVYSDVGPARRRPWPAWSFGILGSTAVSLRLVIKNRLGLGGHCSGPWCSVMFGISAVAFHAGVFATQGIDFFAKWVPVLRIFAVDPRAITLDSILPAAGLSGASTLELCCWAVATLHLLVQLVLCFTCWELLVPSDWGALPFTCMQMFTVGQNLFGDDFLNWIRAP